MNHYKEVEGLPISLISERAAFKPTSGVAVNPNLKAEDKKTGTTTVGIVGNKFILLAADQQATMGNTIADDDARKIYKITDYIALTISGTVGDSLAIIRFLKAQASLYEVERNTRMTPKALTTLLSNVLNGNRYYPFMFMPVVGGLNNSPELYEVTPFGCVSEKKKYAVTGSGTDFALTTLDSEYKESMNKDEALNLAIKAVMAAKNRDIYTGGKTITVVVIDENGYREIDSKEIDKIVSKIKLNVSKK